MIFGATGYAGNGYYPRISMDGTIQANPCGKPDAGALRLAAISPTAFATSPQIAQIARKGIHDRERGRDAHERERELLRLQQLVDARQRLVDVDLRR